MFLTLDFRQNKSLSKRRLSFKFIHIYIYYVYKINACLPKSNPFLKQLIPGSEPGFDFVINAFISYL